MISVEEVLVHLKPTLEALEKQRLASAQQQKRITSIAFPVIAVLILIGLLLLQSSYAFCAFILAGVSGIAALIWYGVTVSPQKREYVHTYKSRVTDAILQQVDPNLHYSMARGISRDAFTQSELYQRPDRYKTEDLVSGKMGATQVCFAEVKAEERRETTDSKGDRKVSYHTIFNGVLFQADFNKEFSGRTFVMPDRAEKTFGRLGRKLQKLGGQRKTSLALMDSPEFEERFAVYTSDEVECRYLLSPALMERILALNLGEIRLGFKDSLLWIAVPLSRSYLEPSHRTPATSPHQIKSFANDLICFLSIVELLDLNTRIWSKK